MRTGVFTFLLISLLAVSPTAFAGEVKEPIDQTITREIDLTGDGVPELISVHLMAKDFDSPFRWKLTINSKGKDIYTVERDDAWFNEKFHDDEFTSDSGCNGYEECKRQYYFEEPMYGVLKMVSPSGGETLYEYVERGDDMGGGGVWHVGKDYLVSERHIEEAKAVEIITALLERLKKKRLPFISITISPVMVDSPMVYVEEINGFMPVYKE